MAVADAVTALPYADGDRMAAAGGSYGGYMIDWLLGHTDRFKAFVSHSGVFDLRSMAAETEELLALAAVAAHASERTAAPVACWLVARAGTAPSDALALASAVAPAEG